MKKLEQRFIDLAELLIQIMVESCPTDVKISDKAKKKTARALQNGYERGDYVADETGALYNVWMIDDYGGLIDKEIQAQEKEDIPPALPESFSIDFLEWQLGMNKKEILKAFNRYKKITGNLA